MSVGFFRQVELPFCGEDQVQMLRDDNRHLREEDAALREENARMRLMLFGSGSEKMEKGDWIVSVEEEPLPEEPQEEHRSEPASGKKEERKEPRRARLKVHVTRRVWHELIPEEVKAEPEKYRRLPKNCAVVSRHIEKVPAHLQEEIYVSPRFARRGRKQPPSTQKRPGQSCPAR